MSLKLNEKQSIIFGDSDQIEFKLSNLQQVIGIIVNEKVEFNEIDLRYNSKIVLR